MESVPCEFVFNGINETDRKKLCSIVKSTNASIGSLEEKINNLKQAVEARRQVLQQNVAAAEQKVTQQSGEGQSSEAALKELDDARQKLSGYDNKVATLTRQLQAYQKLPPIMQNMNETIGNVTKSLTGQELPKTDTQPVEPNPFQMELEANSEIGAEPAAPPSVGVSTNPFSLVTDKTPMTFGNDPASSFMNEAMDVDKNVMSKQPKPSQQFTPSSAVPQQSISPSAVPQQSIPSSAMPQQFTPSSAVPQQSTPSSAVPQQFTPSSALPQQSTPSSAVPSVASVGLSPKTSKPKTLKSILKKKGNSRRPLKVSFRRPLLKTRKSKIPRDMYPTKTIRKSIRRPDITAYTQRSPTEK